MTTTTTTGSKVKPPFMDCLKVWKLGGSTEEEEEDEEDKRNGELCNISDRFDLTFVCSDGLVSTHRIVISNVSRYIMSMMDDQPPWYPTTVHVLDFPKAIIQILVDLAYTGEMRFPQDLQSDVFDAMQNLGWVHTDNLSADFYEDPLNSTKDGEESFVTLRGKKSGSSSFKDLKTSTATPKSNSKPRTIKTTSKSPQSPLGLRRTERFSYNNDLADVDVDESAMEISNLPDIDLSDDDNLENSSSISKPTLPKKVFTGAFDGEKTLSLQNDVEQKASSTTRKSRSSSELTPDENIQPFSLLLIEDRTAKSPARRSSRRGSSRRISISESNADIDAGLDGAEPTALVAVSSKSKPKKEEIIEIIGSERKSRRAVTTTAQVIPTVPEEDERMNLKGVGTLGSIELEIQDDSSQMSAESSECSSLSGTPSKRQRRKPKRFDDEDDLPSSPEKGKSNETVKAKRERKIKIVVMSTEEDNSDVAEAESIKQPVVNVKRGKTPSGSPKKVDKASTSKGTKKITKKAPKKKLPEVVETLNSSNSDDEVAEVEAGASGVNVKGRKIAETKVTSVSTSKSRLSAESASSKNSLITSYFNKTPTTTPTSAAVVEVELPVQSNTKVKVTKVGRRVKDKEAEKVSSNAAEGQSSNKPEKKKRTFDQISDAAGVGKESVGNGATATEEPAAESTIVTSRPSRRSVRAGSSNNSTKNPKESDDEEVKLAEEQEAPKPKRKRTKKENKVETVVVVTDETNPVVQPSSVGAAPSRRSSKK